MGYKNVKVKENTRFVICIDDNFDKTYLKDLNQELSTLECYQVLQENFNEIVKLIKTMETKVDKKQKDEGRKVRNLRVIK